MIEYGNFCGLFLGDAHEEDIYSYMANHCANRKISFNVVKLAHHGSEKHEFTVIEVNWYNRIYHMCE